MTKRFDTILFDAVLATQITEGLIFYVSFACSFYFGYRGKMEGIRPAILTGVKAAEAINRALAGDNRALASYSRIIREEWGEDMDWIIVHPISYIFL